MTACSKVPVAQQKFPRKDGRNQLMRIEQLRCSTRPVLECGAGVVLFAGLRTTALGSRYNVRRIVCGSALHNNQHTTWKASIAIMISDIRTIWMTTTVCEGIQALIGVSLLPRTTRCVLVVCRLSSTQSTQINTFPSTYPTLPIPLPQHNIQIPSVRIPSPHLPRRNRRPGRERLIKLLGCLVMLPTDLL